MTITLSKDGVALSFVATRHPSGVRKPSGVQKPSGAQKPSGVQKPSNVTRGMITT